MPLLWDDKCIETVAQAIFKGIKGNENHTDEVSKKELHKWTRGKMANKLPTQEFDEEQFDFGFKVLDTNEGGTIKIDDIKAIILKKCKEENLYIGIK